MRTQIVSSLPAQPKPNMMYLVPRGTSFDIHISDSKSKVRPLVIDPGMEFVTKAEYDRATKDPNKLYVIKPV